MGRGPALKLDDQGKELVVSSLPSVDDILAGQLAPSSIARYRRDVAAYSAYVTQAGYDH
ncbi:MAG TPA: hypothetical protein VF026_26645 [Ktedonobacteraceae bacterium]